MTEIQKVIVVGTSTNPLLPYILDKLSHTSVAATLLTRETAVAVPTIQSRHCVKHGSKPRRNPIKHLMTDFSILQLEHILNGKDAIICALTGSDINLTNTLINEAARVGVKRFIPSEYGLDTSNEKLRALLPPLSTRWTHQVELERVRAGREDVMGWTAIYAGSNIETSLKVGGDFGLDAEWGTITMFGAPTRRVVVSTYSDAAEAIVNAALLPNGPEGWGKINGKGVYIYSFAFTMQELADLIDQGEMIGKGRKLDRYEGQLDVALHEAQLRLRLGHLDGGLSLMRRVSLWNPDAQAFRGWEGEGIQGNAFLGLDGKGRDRLEDVVRRIIADIRGGSQSKGCGC